MTHLYHLTWIRSTKATAKKKSHTLYRYSVWHTVCEKATVRPFSVVMVCDTYIIHRWGFHFSLVIWHGTVLFISNSTLPDHTEQKKSAQINSYSNCMAILSVLIRAINISKNVTKIYVRKWFVFDIMLPKYFEIISAHRVKWSHTKSLDLD